MTKKRSPQDATLRNVRAAQKELRALKTRLRKLEVGLAVISGTLRVLAKSVEIGWNEQDRRMKKLERRTKA